MMFTYCHRWCVCIDQLLNDPIQCKLWPNTLTKTNLLYIFVALLYAINIRCVLHRIALESPRRTFSVLLFPWETRQDTPSGVAFWSSLGLVDWINAFIFCLIIADEFCCARETCVLYVHLGGNLGGEFNAMVICYSAEHRGGGIKTTACKIGIE